MSEPVKKYDYIISGLGLSGLMLAYRLALDSFFDDKQILLIDKNTVYANERTWCFWEKDSEFWDSIVCKKWDTIYFGSKAFSEQSNINPYYYKCIRSHDFYDFVLAILKKKANMTFVQDKIRAINEQRDGGTVETENNLYFGAKVFNSVLLSTVFKKQKKYPVLQQHFLGWFVKTTQAGFDPGVATFMDFNVAQKGNTRFMYVLPFSETEALFEYTLFSEQVLDVKEYEDEISKYLHDKNIEEYTITQKEKGSIPMTCYDFGKQNTKNRLEIGTAGGWTKPSTGYTFANTSRNTERLIVSLKNNSDLSRYTTRTRFWYYDLLLLDVLYKENHIGALVFSKLFQKNKITKILKFLDEKTTILEEFKLLASTPTLKFLKALWQRLFKN